MNAALKAEWQVLRGSRGRRHSQDEIIPDVNYAIEKKKTTLEMYFHFKTLIQFKPIKKWNKIQVTKSKLRKKIDMVQQKLAKRCTKTQFLSNFKQIILVFASTWM